MIKYFLTALCLVLLVVVFAPICACAESELSVTSREAILIAEDGQVLYEHNVLEKRPIASMTKVMTLLCIYDAIDSGKIALTDNVVASSNAASMGGSQVFLDANATYTVENLIKSIIICSANDSCVAMAEYISGSVQNFVQEMNNKSREIGLVATHFENCTGLPAVSQYSCAKDVATMFLHLIQNKHYFTCANIWMEDFLHPSGRVTGMSNTNKLVRFYQGCDGGKTGYTSEAKHCLTATAKRGDMRVIAVVIGAPDSKTRFAEVSNMFNYAFANYQSKTMLDKTDVSSVKVEGGKQSSVEIVPTDKLLAFGKKGECSYTLQMDVPQTICAPVQKGQVVGKAHLMDEKGNAVRSVDLVASYTVEQKSYWDYVGDLLANR